MSPSLGKSINFEKLGNSYKAQPNGSALRIFFYYCGGITSHYRYSTNQITKTSNLNSLKIFSSRMGKEENTLKLCIFIFNSVLFLRKFLTQSATNL